MRSSLNWAVGVVTILSATVLLLSQRSRTGSDTRPEAVSAEQPVSQRTKAREHPAKQRKEAKAPNPPTQTDNAQAERPLTAREKALAAAQGTCPVCGDSLAVVPRPYKVHVQGKMLFTCSPFCGKHLRRNPNLFLSEPGGQEGQSDQYVQLGE